MTGSCSYKNDLFEPDALQHWIADYTTILAKAAANPETSLGRLVGSLSDFNRSEASVYRLLDGPRSAAVLSS